MKLRERVYSSGRRAWQFDAGVVNGRRVQRSFPTKELAVAAMAEARKGQKKHGRGAAGLTTAIIGEVLRCQERLAEVGASLTEATDFFLSQSGARPMKGDVLLPDLVERFIQGRVAAGCSVRYRDHLRGSLRSLGRTLAVVMAGEATEEQVTSWLDGNGWSPKTRNNYLGDARAMFAWAVDEGYARVNPCAAIEALDEVHEEIGTLTLEQCEKLLQAAVTRKDLCGYVVLGLFGGIRRAELGRMEWSAVNLRERTVIVAAAAAKKTRSRKRRVVDLSANAVAWLRACYGGTLPEGPICEPGFDDVWLDWRPAVISTKDWPHNALRHTYASMHYAHYQDEARLQAQMGHESAAMLHQNYRALKTRAEAARFWSLKPEKRK